jgi:hypothetical protein
MSDPGRTSQYPARNHTIIIRLWAESTSDGRQVWRGRLEHLQSGKVQYFQGFPQLSEVMTDFLGGENQEHENHNS